MCMFVDMCVCPVQSMRRAQCILVHIADAAPATPRTVAPALPPPPPQGGPDYYKDLLAIETVSTLNAAFCNFHLKHCPPSQELLSVCSQVGSAAARGHTWKERMPICAGPAG